MFRGDVTMYFDYIKDINYSKTVLGLNDSQLSEYLDETIDTTFNKVFIRADENMYIRKRFLKSNGASTR